MRTVFTVAVMAIFSGLCLSACQMLHQLGPPSSWDGYLQAADTAIKQKNYDEAEKYSQLAIDDATKNHSDDPTIFVIAASHYAEMQAARGKYKDAEQLYGQALKLMEHLPADNPEVIKLEKALAQVLTKDGKAKEAKQLLANRNKLISKAKQDKAKQDKANQDTGSHKGTSGSRRTGAQGISRQPIVVAHSSAGSSSSAGFGASSISAALESMPVTPAVQQRYRSNRQPEYDARRAQEDKEKQEREENEQQWRRREQELRDMNRM